MNLVCRRYEYTVRDVNYDWTTTFVEDGCNDMEGGFGTGVRIGDRRVHGVGIPDRVLQGTVFRMSPGMVQGLRHAFLARWLWLERQAWASLGGFVHSGTKSCRFGDHT